LLQPPRRTPSGYREYDPETVRIVRFVKRAQELGFTLAQIRDLLRLREPAGRDRRRVLALATATLERVEEKARRLRAIRRALTTLVQSCASATSAPECPILEALEDGRPVTARPAGGARP
jgi:MerR family mercuric resistance operon transcriptional regulator